MTHAINEGYELAITPPEEGAGAAYAAVKTALLEPLGIQTETLPMDLAERILTNGAAVADASKFVKEHTTVTYVKGPGITPREDQVLTAIMDLEKNNNLIFKGASQSLNEEVAALRKDMHPIQSDDAMKNFAQAVRKLLKPIGSPNAAWRSDLAANLARGTSDALSQRSLVQPPAWNANTPLTVAALAADDKNRQTGFVNADTTMKVEFTPDDGSAPIEVGGQKVSAGTPVRLFSYDKKSVTEWTSQALANVGPDTQIAHGTKQTVLKTDVMLIKWMQKVLVEKQLTGQIHKDALLPKEDPNQLLKEIEKVIAEQTSANEVVLSDLAETPQTPLKKQLNDLIKRLGTSLGEEPAKLLENIKVGKLSTASLSRPLEASKELGNLLVDDLFSRLSTSELKNPMLILSPNASYAHYVHDVWEGVKAGGGFKPPQHSEIVRASATGDHYKAIETDKAIEYIAQKTGTLTIKDAEGNVIASKKMAAGDVAMVTHFDRSRVRELVRQTLENARKSGRQHVLFGFDEQDDYYKIAVEELRKVKKQYSDIQVQVMEPALATAYYLTKGVKDTVLLLNNIQGDFATDIEINGKGTSYSVGTIYDGRGVVELGSGGTAPDLMASQGKGFSWEETGTLKFNPMSFIEGISLAMRYASNNMPDGEQKKRTLAVAEALEQGLYATTDKGIVVPIVKGKFKNDAADYTIVSTQTFVKSVQLETMRKLKGTLPEISDAAIAKAEKELAHDIALDKALYAADAHYKEEWRKANCDWNAARRSAGSLDPFNPDFSLSLPQDAKDEKLTAENLFALQKSRAALAHNITAPLAQQELKQSFIALGVPEKAAEIRVRTECAALTSGRSVAA